MKSTAIVSVKAREVEARGTPAVEATVKTKNGGFGRAVCVAGASVGTHEIPFVYDGGEKWNGKGVMRAVDAVHNQIAPAIMGMDAARQLDVDAVMLGIGKDVLGGNATGAVSAAVLKAGASALGIPLYQHIGGASAYTLPVPGTGWCGGSDRYGDKLKRAHGKPSFSFVAYGFDTFSEASYALWRLSRSWQQRLTEKFGSAFVSPVGPILPAGLVKSDAEIFDLVTDTINKNGYQDRIGLQGDIAADCYFNYETQRYEGLFDFNQRTTEEMFAYLVDMPKKWPFVVIEDPLSEDDYASAARFTAAVDIQVVGDDLFTTNPARVLEGIKAGAANTVLLKVNQIGTITEAFDMVSLAYENGYGVMPCSSRGEGIDICDYSVGLKCGSVRESGVGEAGNRFKEIEAELGPRARFAGKQGLKGARFALK
ncbi:MAG: hypothetical protein FWH49_07935 [Clostridiales bacterium]|nr:hypothetical protein [Clostridiales bacterium]